MAHLSNIFSIYVGNLQWWVTDGALERAIAPEIGPGKLVEVRFFEDRVNGKSRGVAQIDFIERVAAETALNQLNKGSDGNGVSFDGVRCVAAFAPPVCFDVFPPFFSPIVSSLYLYFIF